jgi:hypothetical protein
MQHCDAQVKDCMGAVGGPQPNYYGIRFSMLGIPLLQPRGVPAVGVTEECRFARQRSSQGESSPTCFCPDIRGSCGQRWWALLADIPSVQRGSVFYEHFEGDSAVAFLNDGHLAFLVQGRRNGSLRYCSHNRSGRRSTRVSGNPAASADCSASIMLQTGVAHCPNR